MGQPFLLAASLPRPTPLDLDLKREAQEGADQNDTSQDA
jgi:hypothetical protein